MPILDANFFTNSIITVLFRKFNIDLQVSAKIKVDFTKYFSLYKYPDKKYKFGVNLN